MPIVGSALSIFILCLTLASSATPAIDISKGNATVFRKPEVPTNKSSEGIGADSSNVSIQSRILDGKIHRKAAVFPLDYPVNGTPIVEIDVDNDVSTNTKLPIAATNGASSSKIADFKPSIHIGEIDEYESRKSDRHKNPFNRLKHVEFENSVKIDDSLDTDGARLAKSPSSDGQRTVGSIVRAKKIPVTFVDTDSRYGVVVPIDPHPDHHLHQEEYFAPHRVQLQIPAQQIIHQEDANANEEETNENYHSENSDVSQGQGAIVSFEHSHPTGYADSRPMASPRPPLPSIAKEPHSLDYHYQPYEIPAGNFQTVYVKPSKLHHETVTSSPDSIYVQNYQYPPALSGEAIDKPEVPTYQHHTVHAYQHQPFFPHENSMDHIAKPETLFYVTSHRESAFTRTRKFPYKFWEPTVIGQQDNLYHYAVQETPHAFPAMERRVSPWTKIFHLIGTFLPIGLLLAALKPNFVKIENTTQPNIVLSKLRVIDLPAEHKRARLSGNDQEQYRQDTCDDRSICELIVSGSEPTANLLQNLLWNLTNKSTEEEAQKHGLHEIFSAAKRKDCSSIDC